MKAKLLVGLFAILSLTQVAKAGNAASNPVLQQLLGHYVGGDPSYGADPLTQFCTIDITLTKDNYVSVKLKDTRGINFCERQPDRKWKCRMLPQVSHPLIKAKDFVKAYNASAGDLQNSVEKRKGTIEESWYLRIYALKEAHGFVQVSYDKSDLLAIYDGGIAYTYDSTGCYNLTKVQ